MSYKYQKIKKGFTLIELLIVIAIVAIMTGVLLMNQTDNRDQNNADNAARQIAVQLRSLQNDMLSGKMIGSDIACQSVMTLVYGESKFQTKYMENCIPGPINEIGGAGGSTQDYNLKNAQINTVGTTTVTFISPHGKIDGAANITIAVTSNSKNSVVCVNKDTGNITEIKGTGTCSF